MDEACHFDPSNVGATVTGFVDIPSDDEDALKSALATQVVTFLVLNEGFISRTLKHFFGGSKICDIYLLKRRFRQLKEGRQLNP